MAEVKSLHLELDSQHQIECVIKDANYRLKREMEELRTMVKEMEIGIVNCEQCGKLEMKNMELLAMIRHLKDKQNHHRTINHINHNHNHRQMPRKQYSFSVSRSNQRKYDTIDSEGMENVRPSVPRKYLADITVDSFIPTKDNIIVGPGRGMKDSVVRRCRLAIDKN